MGVVIYLAALAATAVVTSVVLWQKHGRHPLGDHGAVALRWWTALLMIDGVVAALLLTGSFTLASLAQLAGLGGIARAVSIGVLGPLAIRSPIREVNIGGKPEQVGLTTVYDKCWIYCDRRLDGQITLLRRKDRGQVLVDVKQQQWSPQALLARIEEHVGELRSLPEPERLQIVETSAKALTLPTEDKQLSGLIKVMLDAGLDSLVAVVRTSGSGS